MMLRVNTSAANAFTLRMINESLTNVDGTAAIGLAVTTRYVVHSREPTEQCLTRVLGVLACSQT